MKRKAGFYWVKWGGKWEVAEWDGKEWLLTGFDSFEQTFYDSGMQQIDERQIINPNE